jgi:hypothetical protein
MSEKQTPRVITRQIRGIAPSLSAGRVAQKGPPDYGGSKAKKLLYSNVCSLHQSELYHLLERVFDNAVAVDQIAQLRCACPNCSGSLTEASRSPSGWGFCRVCRCAWKLSTIDGVRYATAIHSVGHADVRPAEK